MLELIKRLSLSSYNMLIIQILKCFNGGKLTYLNRHVIPNFFKVLNIICVFAFLVFEMMSPRMDDHIYVNGHLLEYLKCTMVPHYWLSYILKLPKIFIYIINSEPLRMLFKKYEDLFVQGNTPSELHLYIMNDIGATILPPHTCNCRIFGPMPTKPVALFGLRVC